EPRVTELLVSPLVRLLDRSERRLDPLGRVRTGRPFLPTAPSELLQNQECGCAHAVWRDLIDHRTSVWHLEGFHPSGPEGCKVVRLWRQGVIREFGADLLADLSPVELVSSL